MANTDRFSFLQRENAIGRDAVGRPVAAADDVSSADAGDFHRVILKKRTAIGTDGDFSRRLAGAVRVVAAKTIFFAITAMVLAIFVTLVRGDENRCTRIF